LFQKKSDLSLPMPRWFTCHLFF